MINSSVPYLSTLSEVDGVTNRSKSVTSWWQVLGTDFHGSLVIPCHCEYYCTVHHECVTFHGCMVRIAGPNSVAPKKCTMAKGLGIHDAVQAALRSAQRPGGALHSSQCRCNETPVQAAPGSEDCEEAGSAKKAESSDQLSVQSFKHHWWQHPTTGPVMEVKNNLLWNKLLNRNLYLLGSALLQSFNWDAIIKECLLPDRQGPSAAKSSRPSRVQRLFAYLHPVVFLQWTCTS